MSLAQTRLSKTAATPPSRLACIEMVHEVPQQHGKEDTARPESEQDGSDFEFTYSLESLEPFREYITIVSGTDARQAEAFAPTEVVPTISVRVRYSLRQRDPEQTDGPDTVHGISIDQLYAQRFGQETPLPSIQLGIEHVDASNSCGFSYNCITRCDQLVRSQHPLPFVINPREAFETLVGNGRRQAGQGIVDAIVPEFVRLQSTLDSDRNRV